MVFSFKLGAACVCSLLLLTGCGNGSNENNAGAPVFSATNTATPDTSTEDGTDGQDGSGDASDAQGTDVENSAGLGENGLQLGDSGLCTTNGINAWVDAQMRDYYIYADQVPTLDSSEYDDPRDLLADLRVLPDIYSSISPQSSRTALFEEGETFGFGFQFRRDQAGALRFITIVSGSPMEDANLLRGDRIIAFNGIPELNVTNEAFAEIFGESGEPKTVMFTIERNGQTLNAEVTSGVYNLNTVPNVQSFELNGATVGYIESTIFIRNSEAELDAAMSQMVAANPTDIILDFRYNGGGFVFVAQKLAAQLAGTEFTGEVFQNTQFNETYERFNQSSFLEAQELNLNLPRIIVLTTGGTASASEAIINNLAPYIDVVVIGSLTAGKPFASVGNPNCDQVLNAMDRITSNDNGETVLGGISPTCFVQDEFLHPMFSADDALFGAALTYLDTNVCPSTTLLASGPLEIRANILTAPIDSYVDLRIPSGLMIQ